jgi:ABC-type polysaccharide/polyol phosphate export permease
MTGVFYDLASKLEKHPAYKTLLLKYNPIANFIHNMRQSLIYSSSPDYLWIFIWFIIGLFLSISGVRKIYKYENTYVKVMR